MTTAARENKRLAIRKDKPDSWIAVNVGDEIRGELVDADNAWSDVRRGPDGEQGTFYPLLTVRGEATDYEGEQELKVHCFGAVLYNEVMKHRPEIGERITIRYLGTGEARVKGQNPPELYRLTVEGRRNQAANAYARIDSDVERRRGPAGREAPQSDVTPAGDQTDEDLPF